MSHRATIARERSDGAFDLYESPSAGFAIDVARARRDLAANRVEPLASDVTLGEAAGRIDPFVHEALYVLCEPAADAGADPGRSGRRTRREDGAYRVLCFRVPTGRGVIEGDPVVGEGALVAVGDLADPEPDGFLRGWFEAERGCLGEAVDRGDLPETEAISQLRDRLARFAGDEVAVIGLPLDGGGTPE